MSEQKVPVKVEQNLIVEFLTHENIKSAEILRRLHLQFGNETLSETEIRNDAEINHLEAFDSPVPLVVPPKQSRPLKIKNCGKNNVELKLSIMNTDASEADLCFAVEPKECTMQPSENLTIAVTYHPELKSNSSKKLIKKDPLQKNNQDKTEKDIKSDEGEEDEKEEIKRHALLEVVIGDKHCYYMYPVLGSSDPDDEKAAFEQNVDITRDSHDNEDEDDEEEEDEDDEDEDDEESDAESIHSESELSEPEPMPKKKKGPASSAQKKKPKSSQPAAPEKRNTPARGRTRRSSTNSSAVTSMSSTSNPEGDLSSSIKVKEEPIEHIEIPHEEIDIKDEPIDLPKEQLQTMLK